MRMIKGSNSGRAAGLRRVAGICGLASQLIGIIFISVTISSSPWFSWTENYVSVLGVKDSATMIFNSGLILTGLLSLVFAVGLGSSLLSGRLLGQSGMVSLILGSGALAAMGIFPRTTGLPHNLASLAFFVFVSLALLLIGAMAINTSQMLWGVLSLTAGVVMITLQLSPWADTGGAISQLVSFLPWSLWTIVLGVRLVMRPKPADI